MKILFCNITWMDYYKGVTKKDIHRNRGSYLNKHNDEQTYNFEAVDFNGDDTQYYLGFAQKVNLLMK